MENEMVNIAELLRDMPEGTMLYSPACGECKLEGVTLQDTPFLISVDVCNTGKENVIHRLSFTKYGQVCDVPDAKCLLFPSEKMRDWSKFFKYKCEAFHKALHVGPAKPKCPFEAFQRVLVRNADADIWRASFFSHYERESQYPYYNTTGCSKQCIPYNEHTAHLIGTSDPYPYNEEKGGDK